MIFYVTFLRFLATCLITNSHYTGIYPTDLIANGGLLGDILFFAISGFCLYNIKGNFPKWYGERLFRVYLPTILITVLFIALGFYSTEQSSLFWWLIYPTYYHFVASICLLYIPFYFICKYQTLRNNIPKIMLIVLGLACIWYLFFYDRSYYHIDVVREPFIRILFFESMLLGAYFRQNDQKLRNRQKGKSAIPQIILCFIFFVLYFISKMFFGKFPSFSNFQIINQFIIFLLLFFIMRLSAAFDWKLEKLPPFIKKIIGFLANITLEIYLVQFVIINVLRGKLSFPLNLLAITASIIAAAYLLHLVCKVLFRFFDRLPKLFSKRTNDEPT